MVQRVWGSEEQLADLAAPHLKTLLGYYGGESARFRFEVAVELPGTLVATNGTQSGTGVVWLFREADLTTEDSVLQAQSVQLRQDALRALGARREFDTVQLLQLVDLLWKRDPQGELAALLARAVQQSSLASLSDSSEVPELLELRARELAELLDPDSARE